MPIGFAVHISMASAAMRSALSSISDASATSQPPVFGTATNCLDLTTSPIFAETLNDGDVSHVSCSMYDPSLDAKYFHSFVICTEQFTVLTPLFFSAASTTF